MTKAMNIPSVRGAQLEPPRYVSGEPMLVVGLSERHSFDTAKDIAAQWQRFMAVYGQIPDKTGSIPIGVITNLDEDGNFEYVCGVEVAKFSTIPGELVKLRVPAQNYAVFAHRAHVSTIGATYSAILNHWLAKHSRHVADGAVVERHLETFDPRTGFGGIEIWMPLQEAK